MEKCRQNLPESQAYGMYAKSSLPLDSNLRAGPPIPSNIT